MPVPTLEPERPPPDPKTASGNLTFATIQIHPPQGLNSTGGPPKNVYPITEDLFGYGFDGNREELLLAESWELADDLSYVDIKIKEGIPWQGAGHGDFGELTAETWRMPTTTPTPHTTPSASRTAADSGPT